MFEILRVDNTIRTLIGSKASSDRILAAAREIGLTTMLEDGFDKAARGITTVDEVLRAVG